MKLIKQSYEILEQEIPVRKLDDYSGAHFREQYIDNMYKHIEKCGKTCYRSEHTIKEGSAKKFVDRLINSGHLSVLEHAVVYLKLQSGGDRDENDRIEKYTKNEYTKYSIANDGIYYITTNYRVIIQNHWEDDLQFLCEPTEYHEKRHTVLLHTCIHVYKDLTRHRKMSFSIESTRYCNYSKQDKFGEMKFVLPPWFNEENNYAFKDKNKLPECIPDKDGSQCLPEFYWKVSSNPVFGNMRNWTAEDHFIFNCLVSEWNYNHTIELGWQPQQAAEVLPQCTAADVVMSGFDKDWEFVFDLRVLDKTGKAHPLVHDVLDPLYDDMCDRGWIFNNTRDD